jgi:hypothetical protein
MSASKEPKSTSILGSLPKNQQEQLDYWLFDERPKPEHAKILERLQLDFGVRVLPSTLSDWKKKRKGDRLLDSIVAGADKANAVMDQAEKNPADTYTALQKLVTHFAIHNADGENDETLLAFVDRVIKFKKEDTRKEMVGVYKQRAEAAERRIQQAEERQAKLNDAVKKAKEGGISAEALKEIEAAAKIL